MLIQGVELRTFCVPLHSIHLKSGLLTGPVVVGVGPSLPVHGASFILGNDLAAYVSNMPQELVLPSVVTKEAPQSQYFNSSVTERS